MQIVTQNPPAARGLPCGPLAAPRPHVDVPSFFKAGRTVFGEGDRAQNVYEVVTGAVRSTRLLRDGRRQIDAFHLRGDLFGFESSPRHRVGTETLEDTTLRVYPRARLDAMMAEDADFARRIVAAMMRTLERAQDHMLLLGRKSAVERMASFLLDLSERRSDNGHLELPMSRADIADHLGLTIETVSRTLTQLKRDGLIDLPEHRRSIVLSDAGALRRLNA